jgi:hypothetical protein
MNTLTPEQRKERIQAIVKIGGLCLTALIVAPFIFTIIQGLVGMIVAFGISYSTLYFWPYIGMKFANWRLKAIRAEANKNPVETLLVEQQRKQKLWDAAKVAVENIGAQCKNFDSKLDGFIKDYPDRAAAYRDESVKLHQIYKARTQKLMAAKDELQKFGKTIERVDAEWQLAQAAREANEAAGFNDNDIFAKIKTTTALDSVQTSLNQAFSSLEISLAEEEADKQKAIVSSTPKALKDAEIWDAEVTSTSNNDIVRIPKQKIT